MSRNSASLSGIKILALRTGSFSFVNFARNASAGSCVCIAPERCAAHNAGKEKTEAINIIPAAPIISRAALFLLDLASESSDACGSFKVHVIVLVFVQLEKLLICIERLKLLSQFIVTGGANKPAAQRQCFSLGKYLQTLQRGGIIFIEILRGN